jgi:hypothetical protein
MNEGLRLPVEIDIHHVAAPVVNLREKRGIDHQVSIGDAFNITEP